MPRIVISFILYVVWIAIFATTLNFFVELSLHPREAKFPKVVGGDLIPDVVMTAPGVCTGVKDAGPAITAWINSAISIQRSISPSSDAAGGDDGGAVVQLRFPAEECSIGSPISIEDGRNLVLSDGKFVGAVYPEFYIGPIFWIR